MTRHDQTFDVDGTTLVVTRSFAAPRDLVFRAYSSCEHLKHWWGPRSWPMRECTLDFRVGGRWHYCLRGPNPEDQSWGVAIYDEIVSPERIAYTDHFSDADGVLNPDMPSTASVVTFEELDGRTRIVIRAHYDSADMLRTVIDMGMEAGLTETLDRLQEHVEA